LEVCEIVMKSIFAKIEKEAQKELKIFGATVPKIKTKIPRLKLKEAQKIIQSKTKRNLENEMDLDPEGEKEICKYVKEKYNSELVFITHFPAAKRPFYTFPDPEDENLTLSFDLLFRGLEIVTGGQRIHSYQMLKEKMKKFGLNPKNFEFYLQAFKYGMPPEGGFALGAERITKQILGLENVKEASLFPRDMTRIDKRLTK
ncbi:aspartate--tRNA(Asn) ligase, partial [Candidatus Parcubacteria bacterium]|nr:aspartate--tRNA(Asn) ligase [Candidatus Parcubacteria bacterium]